MSSAATNYHRSLLPLSSIGRRSLLSFHRRDHPSTDHHDDPDLAAFHHHIADLFNNLSSSSDILSVSWIHQLLTAFLAIDDEYRRLLFHHGSGGPPLDRLMSDYFDRAVKALDALNAVRCGIDQVRRWGNHLDIVLAALHPSSSLNQGRLRRSGKALAELALSMLDSKSNNVCRSNPADVAGAPPPRGGGGVLSSTVYAMSTVLQFVIWILIAAIPCLEADCGLNLPLCGGFPWAAAMVAIHERVGEEGRKGRRRSSGVLREVQRMDLCARRLGELVMMSQRAPVAEEEVRREVEELERVRGVMKDELGPLEWRLREVFHRIINSRSEGLYSLSSHC